MRFIATLFAATALFGAAVDFANLGPAVGAKFPDFSASDQNGTARSLTSLLKKNGAVIVFFRSADW